jgi:hypothetical protein
MRPGYFPPLILSVRRIGKCGKEAPSNLPSDYASSAAAQVWRNRFRDENYTIQAST